MGAVIWPDVFTDPERTYGEPTWETRGKAIADGLEGWACCVLEPPPPGFGDGMVKLAAFLGTGVTAKALHAAADAWHAEKKDAAGEKDAPQP